MMCEAGAEPRAQFVVSMEDVAIGVWSNEHKISRGLRDHE